MDAKTYLSFLKQSNDPRGRRQTIREQNKENYAKFRQAQFEELFYDSLDNVNADDFLNQFVFLPFINALSPDIQSMLGNVTLGVLYIDSINAHTLRSPSGEPLIVFNGGFMALMSHYMETIYTAAHLSNEYGGEFAYSYLMQQYNFIIEYFRGNQAHFPEPIVSISKQHFYSSLVQTVAIETFAVAHELAHVYAGHLDKSQKKNLNILPENNIFSEIYQLSWEHEFDADRIAWNWYQETWKKIPIINELSSDSALTSPLHLFRLMSLIEKYAPIKNQLSSHPP